MPEICPERNPGEGYLSNLAGVYLRSGRNESLVIRKGHTKHGKQLYPQSKAGLARSGGFTTMITKILFLAALLVGEAVYRLGERIWDRYFTK
jgi:hypothetical protein